MILSLIDSKGNHRLLDTQDILYMQTNGSGELHFYAFDEQFRAFSTLKDWSLLLQADGFLQTDRGTIVNTRKINSYDPSLRVVTIPVLDGTVTIPFAENVRRKLETTIKPIFGN